MKRLGIALLALAACALADGTNALRSITAAEIQGHVDILAGPEMQGRGAGSEGGRLAGEYLAEQFKQLGFEPAGDDGTWFQDFGTGMRNVLAVLPGSDALLRDEYVVVGGHYDHLGHGNHGGSLAPLSGGSIHWGADDNASGTAGVLEIAEGLSLDPPRRSVLFMMFDGEERGLLGSEFFCKHPLIPLDKVVAMCNLDMIGRLEGRPIKVYGTGTGSGFDAMVNTHGEALQLELEFVEEMTPNSDHYSFYQKNIPVVHIFSGLHSDYHRPGDVAEKLDEQGAEDIARLSFAFVEEVANQDGAPIFAEVPMGGMDWKEMLQALGLNLDSLGELFGGQRGQGQKPKLGITLEQGSLVIASVLADTPAERAGLQVGDTIVSLDGKAMDGLRSLRGALGDLQGKHSLRIVRDGETLELEVDFGGSEEAPRQRWF